MFELLTFLRTCIRTPALAVFTAVRRSLGTVIPVNVSIITSPLFLYVFKTLFATRSSLVHHPIFHIFSYPSSHFASCLSCFCAFFATCAITCSCICCLSMSSSRSPASSPKPWPSGLHLSGSTYLPACLFAHRSVHSSIRAFLP